MLENISIALISLLFSILFSGSEMAFISSNRVKMQLINNSFSKIAKSVFRPLQKPDNFFPTVLVGNNIALILFSLSISKILEDLFYTESDFLVQYSFFFETLICTTIIILFGEMLPKIFFRQNPNLKLFYVTPFLFVFYVLLLPFLFVFKFFSAMFGYKIEKGGIYSSKELGDFIEEFYNESFTKSKTIEKETLTMWRNALNFKNQKLRDCLIPRNEIIQIDSKTGIKDAKKKFREFGVSRILVFEKSTEKIIGYVHFIDTLKDESKSLEEILFSIPFFPETMKVDIALKKMINQEKNIATVVDEYGSLAGIVTLEDIIEEIVGDIGDEHDKDNKLEKKIGNKAYIFSGRLEIEYLNYKYNFKLPESKNYNTIAGLFMEKYGKIPTKGDNIKIDSNEITCKSVKNGLISVVAIKQKEEPENSK